jgi:hypothetical protein
MAGEETAVPACLKTSCQFPITCASLLIYSTVLSHTPSCSQFARFSFLTLLMQALFLCSTSINPINSA